MISVEADIISGKSMGNIMIGGNISDYIEELYRDYTIFTEVKDNKIYGAEYYYYQLNNGLLIINTWMNGIIFNIICNQNYKGFYKNKIYAGISIGEILSLSKRQIIIDDDYLYLDDDFGLGLLMPTGCDDINYLPKELLFERICVHEPYIFE